MAFTVFTSKPRMFVKKMLEMKKRMSTVSVYITEDQTVKRNNLLHWWKEIEAKSSNMASRETEAFLYMLTSFLIAKENLIWFVLFYFITFYAERERERE